MNIMVTGSTGFIGQALLQKCPGSITLLDLRSEVTEWKQALIGVDVIVHLAARAHVMHDTSEDPLTAFRAANTETTLKLAQLAIAYGVKRFIFLSSVKVNGGESGDRPFSPEDIPHPEDPYAMSKHEAEVGLFRLAEGKSLEVVIIRPPLVYGPGVKGNFLLMLTFMKKGIVMPLGAVNNLRSFIALDNLVDFILICLRHPAAGNQIFLVSDGEDISTTALLRRAATAMGIKVKLIPVPSFLVKVGLCLFGRFKQSQRLLGNLQVNHDKAKHLLGWNPPISVNEGLRQMCEFIKTDE